MPKLQDSMLSNVGNNNVAGSDEKSISPVTHYAAPTEMSPMVSSRKRTRHDDEALLETTRRHNDGTDAQICGVLDKKTTSVTLAQEYLELLENAREQVVQENKRSKRISLLTLVPPSWSRKKVAEYFGASEHQVRIDGKIRRHGGILCSPSAKMNRPLDENTKKSITRFNENELISVCLLGKKDVVRGKQKRLLPVNLKEAHEEWKKN